MPPQSTFFPTKPLSYSISIVVRFAFDDEAARRRLWNERDSVQRWAGTAAGGVGDAGSSDKVAAATSPFATAVNLHLISKSRDARGLTLTFRTSDAVVLHSPSPSSSFELGDFVTLSTMQALPPGSSASCDV